MSFQLDVFRAMWEVYQATYCRPRPDSVPSEGERGAESGEGALIQHPVRYSGKV